MSEEKLDLRDVCHTMTSNAFLIKRGFPPATGTQIRGVGGWAVVLLQTSFIWPRYTCAATEVAAAAAHLLNPL